jgi:hypothetical protein
MNSGVRSAGSMQLDFGLQEILRRLTNITGYRPGVFLFLPTTKLRPVVLER